MKILVTGSNGQLGNHFKLIDNNLSNTEFLFTDLPELDITNEGEVERVLNDFNPDLVINCAAYTAVDKAEQEIEKCNLLNAEAPAILAKLTDKRKIRLIHISTDYVFGGDGSLPYKEDHPKNPHGVYAKSKSLGEDLVLKNNPQSIIIRTSWLYSVYGNNFMKTVLRVCREKGSMRVVCDQTGTPTWAGDLVDGIMTLIQQNASAGIYHYSNEGVCSWYDFAKAIVELSGIDCSVQPILTVDYPTPVTRPNYSALDKTLFRKTTGLEIPWWFDSLKKCLQQLNDSTV